VRAEWLSVVVVGLLVMAPAQASARSGRGVVHRVKKSSETYEQVALHYYGKGYLGHHLRVLNRHPEPLSPGRTLIIPTSRQVPLSAGQDLEAFAKKHLGKAHRAAYLEALHFLKSKRPRPGKALQTPTSLRHVVRPGESLPSIARTYYRDASRRRLLLLRLYNNRPDARVRVGDVLRIPLDTPAFAHSAVQRRSKQTFGQSPPPVAVAARAAPKPSRARAKKSAPSSPISNPLQEAEVAERLYADGRFAQCLRYTKQALEAQPVRLPKATQVELLRLAAASLVALDRVAEAETTFVQLKKLDPKYELDLYQTSPKILDVFDSAR